MIRVFIPLLFIIFTFSNLYASQSTITESEGYACMGEDKSRKQTEQAAMADAKRKAIEQVSTYIQSETQVKDFELQKDLMSAYANATVKVIQELEKGWYKDISMGDCYKIKIKAEVIPDEKLIEGILKPKQATDDRSAPLNIQIWTDKGEYRSGEKIKVYIRGNKPFYARVIYKDADENMVQLLPNPYRSDNYFNGGTIYEIPSGNDRFELEIKPPFGNEDIVVYSSTSPLGDLSLEASGGFFQVKTKPKDIGERTRGLKIIEKKGYKASSAAEFFEERIVVKTKK